MFGIWERNDIKNERLEVLFVNLKNINYFRIFYILIKKNNCILGLMLILEFLNMFIMFDMFINLKNFYFYIRFVFFFLYKWLMKVCKKYLSSLDIN